MFLKSNCLKFISFADHLILITDVTDVADKLEVTLLSVRGHTILKIAVICPETKSANSA